MQTAHLAKYKVAGKTQYKVILGRDGRFDILTAKTAHFGDMKSVKEFCKANALVPWNF